MSALRRSRLPLLLALALVVPTLGVTACGGDEASGTDESAQQLINQTFSGEKKVDSGKVNLDLSAKLEATGAAASQLEGPISLKLTGPFQSQGEDKLPEVDFDMTISAGGQKFTAGAVTTDDQAFIAYQGTEYKIPQDQFERYRRQVERESRRRTTTSRTSSTSRASASTRATGSETPRRKVRRTSAGRRPCTCPRTCGSERCSRT